VAGAACCFDLAAIAGRPYLRSPDDRGEGEEIAVSGDSSAKQKQKDGGGSSTTAI
jgi:hypothetical protein